MPVIVCGTLTLELTVPVTALPLPGGPAHYPPAPITERAGGVGFNLARELARSGHEVRYCAPVAPDAAGRRLRAEVRSLGLSTRFVRPVLTRTPRSVVLLAPDGQRQVLPDLSELHTAQYPAHAFQAALAGARLALMTNAPFTRALLPLVRGVPVLTDLHAIRSLDNPYDAPDLETAHSLFASAELLPGDPAGWAAGLLERSRAELVVRGEPPVTVPVPQVTVVNTTGAGDTLAAAFAHGLLRGWAPLTCLEYAVARAGEHVSGRGQ